MIVSGVFELVARVCDKAFLFLDTLFYRSEYHPGKDHYQQKDVFCSVFCLRHSVAVDSLESCGFVFLLSCLCVFLGSLLINRCDPVQITVCDFSVLIHSTQ